jgi:hypothetical protein
MPNTHINYTSLNIQPMEKRKKLELQHSERLKPVVGLLDLAQCVTIMQNNKLDYKLEK